MGQMSYSTSNQVITMWNKAEVYIEKDQGKARRRRSCKQDILVLAD